MPDISIQFHALPVELLSLIREWVSKMNLHIVAISFQPFSARELAVEELEQAVSDANCRRLVLTESAPSLPSRSAQAFAKENQNSLYLDIGRESARGLAESWLACRTGDVPINKKWKQIASELRANTQAGAVAKDPVSGATSLLRNHRFTVGAKRLSDRGVPILPAAGTTVLQLGLPRDEV